MDPWVGKIPWRRKWLPTPAFLPGEFHGQRSLAGYNPWGLKESDLTEQLTLFNFVSNIYLLTFVEKLPFARYTPMKYVRRTQSIYIAEINVH